MTRIPEATIIEIQRSADIVAVISDSVMLEKRGKDFVGLCPFHTEKTPSFTVSPDKQAFYCFGCGEGGDVFSFVMKDSGLSFPEAVKSLAARTGIEVPDEDLSPEARQRLQRREALLSINREAVAFYQEQLRGPSGKAAREYLRRREMPPETVERFRIGFAPDAWDRLTEFFARRNVSADRVEAAGLIVPRKSGTGYYDRFRNRIIFPIDDARGQIVGLGGRVMDESQPKYLNSPETELYHKGRTLYGLSVTRSACRRAGSVFLVEGYFDLLSLHAHGIENVVATLGTALTPAHLRLLKGYGREAILVFDSDTAGVRAAVRSIDRFEAAGMDARIMVLPEGDDPDTHVRAHGPDAFLRAAEAAKGTHGFLMDTAVRRHGTSVEGRLRVLKDLESPLAAIDDRAKQALYVRELADRLGLDEAVIFERIRKPGRPEKPTVRRPEPPDGRRLGGRLEEKIIAMMIQYPEIIPEVTRRGILAGFRNERLRAIGEVAVQSPGQPLSRLLDGDEDRQRTAAALAMTDDQWDHAGCLRLINQFEARRRRDNSGREDSLVARIRAAEAANDRSLLADLLKDKQAQARKR
jgi:DNA primase